MGILYACLCMYQMLATIPEDRRGQQIHKSPGNMFVCIAHCSLSARNILQALQKINKCSYPPGHHLSHP